MQNLHRLEQGLLVLLLVLGDQLVDHAVAQQLGRGVGLDLLEDPQAAAADTLQVLEQPIPAGQRQRLACRPRVALRVEHRREAVVEGVGAGQPACQPLLLEVADVPQIPDHRAQDGDLLPAQGVPVEDRDQPQRASAHGRQPRGDRAPVEPGIGAAALRSRAHGASTERPEACTARKNSPTTAASAAAAE